jgi:hypothetical protein
MQAEPVQDQALRYETLEEAGPIKRPRPEFHTGEVRRD